MDQLKRRKILKWFAIWQRAGLALEKIKNDELKQYDYKKNEPFVDEMLQWACDHRTTRVSSGLIEQQQIFRKLKDKNIK